MRSLTSLAVLCLMLTCLLCGPGWSEHVIGTVTTVFDKTITARFPVPVQANAIMVIRSGEGEAVAGTAVSRRCSGSGPYEVTGSILFVSDAINLAAGKEVYVNAIDTTPAPSRIELPPMPKTTSRPDYPPSHDLKLYYFAAGQNVGYGTLGLGYEKTLRASRALALEVDGGVTAVGSVSGDSPSIVNTDQLIKSLNGRVRFDFSDYVGFYTAYRWNEGRGDESHWSDLVSKLQGKDFSGPSSYDSQMVMMQGLEYGVTLRPWNRLAMSFGFIPSYRADYGGIGVRTEPGYTGELRFGTNRGALRLRGIKSDGYWQADMGITLR